MIDRDARKEQQLVLKQQRADQRHERTFEACLSTIPAAFFAVAGGTSGKSS